MVSNSAKKPFMKILLPSLVVCSLVTASVAAICRAVADEAVADVNTKLYEAAKERTATGALLGGGAWSQIESEAKLALRLAPQNGHYWNALARVNYEPQMLNATPVSPDYRAAYEASTKAVVAQPSSAYTWASLLYAADHLYVQNQLPGGQAALEHALSRATVLGSREPYVLGVVTDLGLANWSGLSATGRDSVMRAVEQLAKRNPDNALAIASRRGSLPVVCRAASLARYVACQPQSNAAT
jgi:hypothetical protein